MCQADSRGCSHCPGPKLRLAQTRRRRRCFRRNVEEGRLKPKRGVARHDAAKVLLNQKENVALGSWNIAHASGIKVLARWHETEQATHVMPVAATPDAASGAHAIAPYWTA